MTQDCLGSCHHQWLLPFERKLEFGLKLVFEWKLVFGVGAGVGSARLQACIEELGILAKSCHSGMTSVSVPIGW